MSMAWHRIAAKADLPVGEVRGYLVGDVPVALYNVEGEIFATHNVCTHAFALLSDGYLDEDRIECPLHQGVFCVRDGRAVDGPVDEDLRTFPVKLEGDDILVEV